MSDNFATVLGAFSLLEVTAVMLALAYLVLVIQQNVFCWPAQLVSSFLYVAIFFQARLYMESVLNLFFAAMQHSRKRSLSRFLSPNKKPADDRV